MKKIYNSKKICAIAIAMLTVVVTLFFVGCTSKQIQVKQVDGIDAGFGDRAYEYLQTLSV